MATGKYHVWYKNGFSSVVKARVPCPCTMVSLGFSCQKMLFLNIMSINIFAM